MGATQGGREMKIEIVKGGDTPVTQFFFSSSTPDTDELYNSLLAENPGNYIYLEVMLQHTRELERERNELIGVIKSLRKNAREDSDRIDELEKALSYGKGGKTLLSKFLKAVKDKDELQQEAKLLVKLLVLQIEHPAYSVDDVVGRLNLMEMQRNS
jgi:hypothetical protein